MLVYVYYKTFVSCVKIEMKVNYVCLLNTSMREYIWEAFFPFIYDNAEHIL